MAHCVQMWWLNGSTQGFSGRGPCFDSGISLNIFFVEPAGSSYRTVPVSMHLWVERAKKEHIS